MKQTPRTANDFFHKMDDCVLWLHPLSPVPADDRVKVFRPPAALYHGVMAKVCISDGP